MGEPALQLPEGTPPSAGAPAEAIDHAEDGLLVGRVWEAEPAPAAQEPVPAARIRSAPLPPSAPPRPRTIPAAAPAVRAGDAGAEAFLAGRTPAAPVRPTSADLTAEVLLRRPASPARRLAGVLSKIRTAAARPRRAERTAGLPAGTEVLDGAVVVPAPQTLGHSVTVDQLAVALRQGAPAGYQVRRGMAVDLGAGQRPVPDVLVAVVEAPPEATAYPAPAVRLVVEVVSPDSEQRDRGRKPQLYAQAGIPHFWRVEIADGRPVVHVHALDAEAGVYRPVRAGIHLGWLHVSEPYPTECVLPRVDVL